MKKIFIVLTLATSLILALILLQPNKNEKVHEDRTAKYNQTIILNVEKESYLKIDNQYFRELSTSEKIVLSPSLKYTIIYNYDGYDFIDISVYESKNLLSGIVYDLGMTGYILHDLVLETVA